MNKLLFPGRDKQGLTKPPCITSDIATRVFFYAASVFDVKECMANVILQPTNRQRALDGQLHVLLGSLMC